MSDVVNIYCDESCHLENDGQPVMGLGAVMCPIERLPAVKAAIRELKENHNARGELKWEKVSPSRLSFYLALVDYFFAEPALRFRGWLVKDKGRLDHDFFNAGSHDSFYYKMLYYLLEPLIQPPNRYHVYLDVKDTRSRLKVRFLAEVLRAKKRDPQGDLVARVQSAPAEELHVMQLADFLLGALCYRNRPTQIRSQAKLAVVKRIEEKTGGTLLGGTPPWEEKYNYFTFRPREVSR
jgi:hypothetical protein